MGSQAERTPSKAAAERPRWAKGWLVDQARWLLAEQEIPHLNADKLGGTTGERHRPCNPGLQHWEIKPIKLQLKNLWGLRQ